MTIIFWIGGLLLAHTYIFYPFSLAILGWLFGRSVSKASGFHCRVSIIIAAYNEEKAIEEKIRNCLELDYPEENLEIIIGSDGSTDRTNEIARKFTDNKQIKLVEFEGRSGKSAVLNRLVKRAKGDIILFCDANTILLKNAVQKLVINFEEPKIGCVCGRLILRDSTNSSLGEGESLYWALESEIKRMEGRLGILLGANGAIYAIRKELYHDIPEDKIVMDDFYITTWVLKQGKKAVYEPLAIGSEETSADIFGEFVRKVRIGQANFNLIKDYLSLLNPALGLVAYSFFSHKFLRWIGPFLLLTVFTLNMGILLTPYANIFYWLLAAGQSLMYLLAFLGYFANRRGEKTSIFLTLPFYFVSMNVAIFWGMFKAALGGKGGMWERVERTR